MSDAPSSLRVEREVDGVAVLLFDCPGKSVNTLSLGLLDEVEARAGELADDEAVRAIVVASAKPTGFIAGADLDAIEAMERAEEAAELSRRGNALLTRLAESAKPVVAAVHGPALGGGLEVALACHAIVASDDPATVLALPEVMLGLLPAAGGTQRLPRRVGLIPALPMLLTGKRVRARRAYKMGLVDVLTTPGGIAATAARIAARMADGRFRPRPRKRTLLDRFAAAAPGRRMVLKKARAELARKARGLYPAPTAILECVETGLRRGLAAGLEREGTLFGALAVSHESSSLRHLFHWQQELKRERGEAEPLELRRLAVLGGGFMGAGVASVSLGHYPVVLRDLTDDALAAAARTVRDGLTRQARSGAIVGSERDRRMNRLQLTTDAADLAGTELVVEAVFEDLDLKRRVLAEAERHIGPETVFASNTSALPIASIARDARHPERVLGMHYFSPVPKMPLLEIVAAERTAPWAIETARALGLAQGKTVIVVRDGPGFYTTRILAAYFNEAMLLLEEGAGIAAIDRAMKDFGFPVGPLALIDEVGIDVAAHVARDLSAAFAERAGADGIEGQTSEGIGRMFEAGRLGRKNGKGFYRYGKGRRGGKQVDGGARTFFAGGTPRAIDAREIQERMGLVMTNEAARCLEEGVLACPRDGDVGAVFGLGFPPFHAGPFRYVDRRGADDVLKSLRTLGERHGSRFAPSAAIAERAGGGRFYPHSTP